MAGIFPWGAIIDPYASYLAATLNAMANGVIDIGAAIDNETPDFATHMDLAVKLASLDLSAQSNPSLTIYKFESIDGGTLYDTNEDGVSAATDIPTPDKICAIMGLRVDTGAEAKYAVRTQIPIAPCHFKLGLRNTTGQTFGATLNVLYNRTYTMAYT